MPARQPILALKMISDLDIYRAANLLIHRHGADAVIGSSSSGENTSGSPAFVSIMAIRPSSLAFAGSARGAVVAPLVLPGYRTRPASGRCARLGVRRGSDRRECGSARSASPGIGTLFPVGSAHRTERQFAPPQARAARRVSDVDHSNYPPSPLLLEIAPTTAWPPGATRTFSTI